MRMRREQRGRVRRPAGLFALGLLAPGLFALGLPTAWPVQAADIFDPGRPFEGEASAYGAEPLPRYFPRAEGEAPMARRAPIQRRRVAGCIPRRAPVPTDRPGDPSYVGSAYGLGKPSYYGFTPPLGVDDPYGRPLLPYCP